jgi:hypothetical protein
MAATAGLRTTQAAETFDIAAGLTKPENHWVTLAWTVLEAADDLGDDVTTAACQRVIDDDAAGNLPGQSDMNTVFNFLNDHAH